MRTPGNTPRPFMSRTPTTAASRFRGQHQPIGLLFYARFRGFHCAKAPEEKQSSYNACPGNMVPFRRGTTATRFAASWTFSVVGASVRPLASKYRPILFLRGNLPLRTCERCDPLYQPPFRFLRQLASTCFSWPSFSLSTNDSHPIHSSLPPSTNLGDRRPREKTQNRKYLCASGKTRAGSQPINSPSTRTSYVSASTWIFGIASLWTISFFPMLRQFRTAAAIFFSPSLCGSPAANAA